ncbi:MAG: hypothetical protein LBG96_06640 [Tannerella sp.]|jgi:hypothetical protein|nr:hypothetical protein [Tannerella sp.]
MKNIFLLCAFIVTEMLSVRVYAQAPYNDSETAKLREFLLQESAETGVKNYQQLGLTQMDNIDWAKVSGLSWNSLTYLLERVSWAGKKLSGHMDFSDFADLKYLYCSLNDIKSVDITNSPSLLRFDFYENDLAALDVTTNPKLEYIRVSNNNIRTIDLSNNPDLGFFCCTKNKVESLDFSNKEKLYTVYCIENNLHSLKVENCIELETLLCGSNRLTSLNLYNLPFLKSFSCAYNKLTDLQFYNCKSMNEILCNNNELASLDVSSCENLSILNCNNNRLTSLEFDGCAALTSLYCESNLLDCLDVSNLPSLSELSCKNNNLSFSTLPPATEQLVSYSYSPQNYVALECKYDSIDLSGAYMVNNSVSRYSWYFNYTIVSPSESDKGLFAFDASYIGETFICRVLNNALPKLVMHYDVTFTRGNETNNVNPESRISSVYASRGYIHVMTVLPAEVKVYSLQGVLLMMKNVDEGHTDIPFERGIYVVVVDDKVCYKLIVR